MHQGLECMSNDGEKHRVCSHKTIPIEIIVNYNFPGKKEEVSLMFWCFLVISSFPVSLAVQGIA